MTPNFPGTNVPMPPRPRAHSESEVTPRTEMVLQKVRDAEDQRTLDLAQVNLRLGKVEGAVDRMADIADRMEIHLDAAEDRERAKAKRAKRLKWVGVSIGAPVLVAVVGSGAAAWTTLMVQARSQARASATQAVQSELPSTESTYLAGVKAGAKMAVDEQLRRLQENPPPLGRAPDRVAAAANLR